MTEIVKSGSMSGQQKRSDGPFGEDRHERRDLSQAPPVLHATALVFDSTLHGLPALSLSKASNSGWK